AGDPGVPVATGATGSSTPESDAARLGLPKRSAVIPAGSVSENAPSVIGWRMKRNVDGVQWAKSVTVAPETCMAPAANGATASPKSTVIGIDVALVGPIVGGVNFGVGGTLSNVTSSPAGVVAAAVGTPLSVEFAASAGIVIPTVPCPVIPLTSTKYESPVGPFWVTVALRPRLSVPAPNPMSLAVNPLTGLAKWTTNRIGPVAVLAGWLGPRVMVAEISAALSMLNW